MNSSSVRSNSLKMNILGVGVLSSVLRGYSQTWFESHCLQHQPLYNNTHGRNGFNGLCTKCPGYNNNLVITAHFSGTKGVVVNKFDCTIMKNIWRITQCYIKGMRTVKTRQQNN